MSWITIVWSMNAAACLTLAGIYLLVWCKQREGWVHLVFSCSAVAAAALTAFELVLLRAQTSEQYGAILRWVQLPVWVLVVSLVVFVRLYLRAGRPWLAWSVCGVRTLALILNFIFIPNLSYREITSLRQVSWWGGETVSVPVGVTNPWVLVAQLSLLLFVIFFVDATITAWRRGDRQRALVVGGALIFFSAIAVGEVVLVVWGIIQAPFFACFSYLGLITAMGYEMGSDMLRAAQLARQLRASEADLRESKERIDLAANAAGLVVWTWDIPGDQVWLSDKDRALLGFSQWEKLNAERIRSVVHPEDRQLVRQLVEDSLTTGGEIEAEYRVVLPDGKVRWVARRAQVELDAHGKPVWERGVLWDITQRRQAEEKFRLAVEASPIGIILVNDKGRIVLVNAQTEKLFGYVREEIINQPVEILVPERFHGAHPGHRARFLAAPEARAMGAGRELFARRKDDSEFPVEIGINPIKTSDGMLVLAAIVDISARKQAELDAQRHRSELAHLSRVSLMGELAASLAHELNQPLAGIVSNAAAGQRFIDHGNITLPELRELLVDISADGRRASEVVRGIRRMVKKGETIRQQMNLNDVVKKVVQIVSPDALLRVCEVKTSLEPSLPAIEGDPIQLQQLLLNLVINAFDAMRDTPAANRKVEITTEWNGDGAIRTSVRDYGVGISEETRERLFDPFFTTKAEGLGMGLAIVRSILESHAGTIVAENVEGGGARFHFTLLANALPSK
jgi:PAS domain S-box-containing protein